MMFGRGLNSIRVRFALLTGCFTGLSVGSVVVVDRYIDLHAQSASVAAALVIAALLVPCALTYLITGMLTGAIEQLRRSTEAIANGDLTAPIDVDCKCEVGGLADSFRTMVNRVNANIRKTKVLAYVDGVTRLPNRRVLTHVLETGLAGEGGAPLRGGLLFIDLDGFKYINDTLGHDAGDEILRAVSHRILTEGLGLAPENHFFGSESIVELTSDLALAPLLVRFAGDEFIALMPGLETEEALSACAERVIRALDAPFHVRRKELKLSCSIGMAILHQDAASAEAIITCADLAMNAAKQAGKNRIVAYAPVLGHKAMDRARTETELGAAIVNGELRVVYQPKVAPSTLEVESVEALVRWQHPTQGLLSPARFIDIAEKSGLIEPLGREVLRIAAAQCREWLEKGIPRKVSINVCHSEFSRPDFAESALGMIREAGIPCNLVELELTETVAMADPELSRQHLEMLREAGVATAIDDFGIGYSNLSQLAQLPFDTLKIDRSLISGIGIDNKREHIINAILQMAAAMGHSTVAEGVETVDQFDYLADRGCTLIQGFVLAKPMTADELQRWERESLPKAPPAARLLAPPPTTRVA